MDNNEWSPKRRLELNVQRSLTDKILTLQDAIEGLTDPFDITNVIHNWLSNMTFHYFADDLASKLVSGVLNSGNKTWRQAARESSNGRAIYEALRKEMQGPVGMEVHAQFKRNAEIIKSMPMNIADQMTKYIGEESMKGRRASAIAEDLIAKFPDVTRKKAALIARTETSKTSTVLTRARAESIGIPAYIWRSSEDGRVRDSHRHMDGVIVFWRDPPSPEELIGIKSTLGKYHAGNAPNCRCYPSPVINLDYVNFPCKVYRNNTITTMTRHKFESIM